MNVWNNTWAKIKTVEIDEMTEMIFQMISNTIDFEGKSVLELGCGTGRISYLAARAKAKKVTLIDSSGEALKRARELFKGYGDAKFVLSDIFEYKTAEKFDVVMSSGLIEHFKGDLMEKVLMIHKSHSSDKVVVIVPASPHWNDIRLRLRSSEKKYGWQRPIGKISMAKMFQKMGMDIVLNQKFYTIYGLNHNFSKKSVYYIKRVTKHIDAVTGGLLLTVAEKNHQL